MDELWEEFIECFREETRMLFDEVNEYCYCYICYHMIKMLSDVQYVLIY